MGGLLFVLDVVLCIMLVVLAWAAITFSHLYRATVMFIVFGLAMAIAWARLSAPDIALAEAAIGAGITGALLLSTLEVIERHGPAEPDEPDESGEDPA